MSPNLDLKQGISYLEIDIECRDKQLKGRRQRDREIERQRDKEIEKQRYKEKERQKDKETKRQRDRKTEIQRDKETELTRKIPSKAGQLNQLQITSYPVQFAPKIDLLFVHCCGLLTPQEVKPK